MWTISLPPTFHFMKPTALTQFLFAVGAFSLTSLHAQQAPQPQPQPRQQVPGSINANSPIGNPDDAADSTNFKTAEERRNYALGIFMANQLKRGEDKPNLDEVEAGLKAVLSGEKSSDYVNGASLGNMLKRDELKVDVAQLMAAVRDGMSGAKSKLSENGMRNEMQLVQQEALQRRQEKAKIEGEQNMKDATAFLEKNATAEGVTTTPTGLQFKVIKPGKGEKPKADEYVSVNYIARLKDGKEFERSPEGQPRALPQTLNKGWEEAMKMMEVGSKYQFWLPPALAYGEAGRPPQVKPNALISYEVELVGTQPAPTPQVNPAMTTPPISIPGAVQPKPNRQPISATTPPVSIDIPQKAKDTPKTDAPKETPAEPKK